MSFAIRRRAAAFAAVGVLAGLPLIGAAPAWAEPEAGPNVDFNGGGIGVLLCGSKPATSKISVPSETKVRLTNNLKQDATLVIDGQSSAAVSDGETVEVQFHRGPVSVAMVPQCLLNLNPEFEPLTVEVAAPAQTPAQIRATPTKAPASSVPTPGAASRPTPSSRPSSAQASPPAPGNTPEPVASSDIELPVPGTTTDPMFPDDAALPAVPGDQTDPGATVESPATLVNPDGSDASLAGQNLPVDQGPIGLLAIIATVCVVGVSAGAIRAIIAQRATRVEFA